ncbi:hypothetical protein [Variovorax boronicumulans]
MKRFALFAGRDYDHTGGGWRDFAGSFDDKHEAMEAGFESGMDWWHVIDLQTGEEVANGD